MGRTAPGQTGSQIRWLAWIAMFVASSLPDILFRTFGDESPAWLPFLQIGLLLVTTVVLAASPKWRPLCGFLLALAGIRLGWSVIKFALVWSWLADFSANLKWAERWFLERVLALSGAVVIALTLIGSRLTRRDLFLRWGDPSADAQPEPPLWFRPISWSRLGVILLIFFGIALPIYLYFSLRPDFSAFGRAIRLLPWGIATAALNAANEEFQFRCVPLARLNHILPDRHAVVLTACLFGLEHFYGQPSGPGGVVLAGIAGWLWGKSMIETRGWTWAFLIHMVQDIVIFAFLAMTPPSP